MSNLKARLSAMEHVTRPSSPARCLHVFAHEGPCVPGAPFDHARALARLAPPEIAEVLTPTDPPEVCE